MRAGADARSSAADARIAHQHVEPVGGCRTSAASPRLGQVGQVGQDGAGAVRPGGTSDVIGGAVQPSLIPAVQDQDGPIGGECLGQGPA
jgi:hypothetical protein